MLRKDLLAIALLVLVWGIFFWRILTPIDADQASFKQGDFSAQFVTFGAYQYARLTTGEVPLWNPYNNAGLPFIGDTQAAVWYPPRLATILVAQMVGGWSYAILQIEAILHVLAYSIFMYVFLRRLTIGSETSQFGAIGGAIVAAYGGYIAGYPPLQLALLEAGIWLPLGLLGILEASRVGQWQYRWMVFSGVILGISWMAGHPQTSWFLTYWLMAWTIYRAISQGFQWHQWVLSIVILGFVSIGITAVTLLPGIEYLVLASRADMGFDAKGNGFPFQDIFQIFFPGVVSLFSPLFIGITSLLFVLIAVRERVQTSLFWLISLVIGLALSFGANTAFYYAVYNIIPGLRFFRGQERSAFIIAGSLAILVGLGLTLFADNKFQQSSLYRKFSVTLLAICASATGISFMMSLGGMNTTAFTNIAMFSTFMSLGIWGISVWQAQGRAIFRKIAVIGLIVFELFSVSMDTPSNYDPIPPIQQIPQTPSPLIQMVLDAPQEQPFRVDGFRELGGNFGSLYGIMDIRGISPLFLQSAQRIIYHNYVYNPRAWEIFAVRYVFSERETLGEIETQVIGTSNDSEGAIYLHEITNPRPFAHLVYHADTVDSDVFAGALMDDPRYQLRDSIILLGDENYDLPETIVMGGQADITVFEPESITIAVSTPENAILSIAQVNYPGWNATLDGLSVPILRAYGALSAIAVPAGSHEVILSYQPLSYQIGAGLSLFTWGAMIILVLSWLISRQSRR